MCFLSTSKNVRPDVASSRQEICGSERIRHLHSSRPRGGKAYTREIGNDYGAQEQRSVFHAVFVSRDCPLICLKFTQRQDAANFIVEIGCVWGIRSPDGAEDFVGKSPWTTTETFLGHAAFFSFGVLRLRGIVLDDTLGIEPWNYGNNHVCRDRMQRPVAGREQSEHRGQRHIQEIMF